MVSKITKSKYSDLNQDVTEIERYNRYFRHYQSKRSKWIRRAQEFEMIVHNDVDGTGTQFTEAELKTIIDKNLIGTSINLSLPVVEILQAFITANSPIPDVTAVGESSKDYTYFWRENINATLKWNDFNMVSEQWVKDEIITGRGAILARPGNFYQNNEFNVIIDSLDWRNYYPDPQCKLRSHQDQEMFFVATPIGEEKAKKVYKLTPEECELAGNVWDGNTSDKINNPYDETGFETNELNQKTIWVQEIYEKVQATLYILSDGNRTFIKPEAVVDSNGQAIYVVREDSRVFVKKIIKIGNYIKSNEILPISLYPIGILGHTHNRNPYEYGMIGMFIDLSHATNKVLALMMENAQQQSNSGWIAPEGSITNPAKFVKDLSQPGGVATYVPNPDAPNMGLPTQKLGAPLANAFYSLLGILEGMIEHVTGLSSILQGSPEGAPETLGATNQISSFGMQRPKMYARRMDSSLNFLGKVIIEMIQAYAPEENVMRYINNTSAEVEIRSNVNLKFEQTPEGQKISQGDAMLDETQKASVIEIINKGVIEQQKVILGDMRHGQYNVAFKSSNNLPSTRAAAMEFLKTLLGRMQSDNMSVAITESLFKLADFAEADEILRNVNQASQLEQQLQQSAELQKEMENQINVLTKQLDRETILRKEAEIDSVVKERQLEIDAEIKDIQKENADNKKEKKEKEKKLSYS
jgi:hypothetical protein